MKGVDQCHDCCFVLSTKIYRQLFALLLVIWTAFLTSATRTDNAYFRGDAQRELSPYDPHLPSRQGSWFEGWYTRITDADGLRSLAVIVASYKTTSKNTITSTNVGETAAAWPLPGYLAVLISDGGNDSETRSFEVFPNKTFVYSRGSGKRVEQDPDFFTPPLGFEWIAKGFGSVTEDSIDLRIPDQVHVHATVVGERVLWNKLCFECGPLGLVAAFVPFPLFWHVHSLGSPVDYNYTILSDQYGDNDIVVQSHGSAHMEKNWGSAFPSAWSWGQGISDDNGSHYAYAGGKQCFFNWIDLTVWVVGYRSNQSSWNFRPPFAMVSTVIDACHGDFKLTVNGFWRTLTLESSAPTATFGNISIPMEEGYVTGGGAESFSATTTIRLFWHTPWGYLFGWEYFVEEKTFQNAALEFGAEYQCPN